MKASNFKKSSFAFSRYIYFFVLSAFLLTTSFSLFFASLEHTTDFTFNANTVRFAAITNFLNVFITSLWLTITDYVYNIYKVRRPVRRILNFTDDLAAGEFGKELEENKKLTYNEFDAIITNLNKLSRELNSIESLRADFISNISHEIKTPITVIQNYIQLLLLDNSLSEEQKKEYLEAMLLASRKLSTLVSNVLRLTKLEKQEIFKKNERFSLSSELAECIFLYDEKIEEKHIRLEVDIIENAIITSDKELLDIIWNNLISNAIKFTGENGIISITLREENGHYAVEVRDSGCGIGEDEIKHIFDKFYQGESGHKKEGNGLGLALVHRIATILGADLDVRSTLGKGTTFTVTLY